MADLDPRVINLGIIIDGKINWYKDLYIEAKGKKYANPSSGECTITVLNLRRDVREYILRNTKPRTPKKQRVSVILEVGRVSYGAFTLYQGDVFRSEPTALPDLGISLTCRTAAFAKNDLITRSANELTALSRIAQWIAEDLGVKLSFEIPDRNIKSYSFTGSAFSQMAQFQDLANCEVYVDRGVMTVKNVGAQKKGLSVRDLSASTGLMLSGGTEAGMKCKMLYDPVTNIGSRINLTSTLNPSLNGSYVVYTLSFHVTNRAEPFYLDAECGELNGN